MPHPPARWALRSAALPLLASIVLALVTWQKVDAPGWGALGYAVLAVGCGGLAFLLVVGLLAWVIESIDGAWLNKDTALLPAADLVGLAVAVPALLRGTRRLREA